MLRALSPIINTRMFKKVPVLVTVNGRYTINICTSMKTVKKPSFYVCHGNHTFVDVGQPSKCAFSFTKDKNLYSNIA